MIVKIINEPLNDSTGTEKPGDCGQCGKSTAGTNPEITIDGIRLCSKECVTKATSDGKPHEFEIRHNFPTEGPNQVTLGKLIDSLKKNPPKSL